ncbi:MAG: cysteine desulfurase [Candidatus Pacebacteria bacterium]|nr:cysteine desulfurase [Candidatus Paceibacterota bacterium]
MIKNVYLDNASTTQVDEKVLDAMIPYFRESYGNPSSLHHLGRINKDAIDRSRKSVADSLGVIPSEIIFTSGGTEADNLAIFGLANAYKHKGKHIIVSSIEHKAVLDPCKRLEDEGFSVTYLKANKQGFVSVDDISKNLRPDTILISVMYANNEIGTIQPIKQIVKMLKKRTDCSPIFHTDACQATGALSINIEELGVDALTISASKIYGPKGIGALYLNKKYKIEPILLGGGQERGLRSGTENIANIVGFAKALELSESKREKEFERLIVLRDYFLEKIQKNIKGVVVNGSVKNRLPNNINVSIPGVEGEALLLLLDDKGVYCSTGSACSSFDLDPSHVLVKIGLPLELAHCSVRFTLGRYTKKSDADYAVKVLTASVERIRNLTSLRYK